MCDVPTSYPSPSGTILPSKLTLDILLPLGEYFQIQDDFLDYSSTHEQIGKIVIENKRPWCINTALSLISVEQSKILDANYGRKEARMKAIYEELGLRQGSQVVETIPEAAEGAPETVIKRES